MYSQEITNSTHALIIYKYKYKTDDGRELIVDFWDTAGQSKFETLHESYFFEAHGAVIVFDTTRKITYKNSINWYNKFRSSCPSVPCVAVGNKIDIDPSTTERNYSLVDKMNCEFYLTSAADGTNCVWVSI
jgi:small GTP-binding protein